MKYKQEAILKKDDAGKEYRQLKTFSDEEQKILSKFIIAKSIRSKKLMRHSTDKYGPVFIHIEDARAIIQNIPKRQEKTEDEQFPKVYRNACMVGKDSMNFIMKELTDHFASDNRYQETLAGAIITIGQNQKILTQTLVILHKKINSLLKVWDINEEG